MELQTERTEDMNGAADKTIGEDEGGQEEITSSLDNFTTSQREENPEGEDEGDQEEVTAPDGNFTASLREENPDGEEQIQHLGEQVEDQQDEEEGKKDKSPDQAGLPSSQVIPQRKSPPEQSVTAIGASCESSCWRHRDSGTRSSSKKGEDKRLIREDHGEGDAYPSDKGTIPPSGSACDSKSLLILAVLAALLAVIFFWFVRTGTPPAPKGFKSVDVFHREMDKVQSSFPNQHKELWRRSRIHLQRHLQLTRPSEPVSLILTAGRGAEKTLGCLAQGLATAFSAALNASALDINGVDKVSQDSDQAKLDIDRALREAFDGGKQAAVIHRFEKLPPGSTLIFYRYCDHENAAYKNVFLTFTVLLDEELDIPPDVSLGMVEETVQEYLMDRFVSSERTARFNQMDVDKLSGLWSRISHLILPVSAEQQIEQNGCGGPE